MPRIWYEDGYRFSFSSSDRDEPPHVDVCKGDGKAKWWLDPIKESRSERFRASERAAIGRILRGRKDFLIEAWRRFFEGE